MKKRESEVKNRFLKIRMNHSELQELEKLRRQTTERTLSNYARRVLLQQPVIIRYRNSSADDFLRQMVELKKELSAVGNNFNQAVDKLHLLETIPEFRLWIKQYESLHFSINQKVNDINLKVLQLYEQWLLK